MRDPGERIDLLEDVLRALPDDGFVLRGSLLARQWIPDFPRTPEDLDLVGTGTWDVDRVAASVAERLDPERFPRVRGSALWEHTDFPGVRVQIRARGSTGLHGLTVDVGFGDPLVPEPSTLTYRPRTGDPFPVPAVHPATAIAWKLHGVAERPPHAWRPKDLLDLDLLLAACPVDPDALRDAVRAAFVSRGDRVDDALAVLRDGRFDVPDAPRRWSDAFGPTAPTLPHALERVRAHLLPALGGPHG